ncbi:hypothetical protein [Gracilimonas sp.]|uniref:hypothetical protein n=1 Tax=Gracilimonas sp. TaxID=1974203 RepID=UPI003BAA5928
MMKRILFAALFSLTIAPVSIFAQLYNTSVINRPGGLNWLQIKTEHFRIIFPEGEDSLAYRSAAILESEYAKTSKLTGGKLSNFPVILNNYNDLSNGFVTSFNFRSEIELAAIKGKGMNPQSGDWLETVLPHELIHATHFNVQQPFEDKKVSIPNFISLLSPDIARTFHGFAPVGLHEGLAVYYETESVTPQGGRGNYSFFNNRFNANFASPGRWNMGQTLIPSDYTQPYNRHYISGYTFIDWLHENYGDEISKKAIRYHYHNFFLGYGVALRAKTGKWPGQLYALYEEDLKEKEEQRLAEIEVNTTENSLVIDTPFKGEEIHGPKWISESKLLFYGSFYNGRIGFYQYDLETGDMDLVKEVFSVEDYNFEIEAGTDFYFSNYSRDPLIPTQYIADVQKLNLDTGKSEKLTKNARVYAPTSNGERILGIQTSGSGGNIVEILEGGKVRTLKTFDGAIPDALRFNPQNPEQMAVILKRRGVQALWITSLDELSEDVNEAPDLAFEHASIFDPQWHPDGDRILFSLDVGPAMNVYEYNLQSDEVMQLTSSLYNAFEASYSPDGSQIAYIVQKVNERKLAVLNRDDFLNAPVPVSFRLTGSSLGKELTRPLLGFSAMDSISAIEPTPYGTDVSWLKPRAVYPVLEEKAGTYQYGAGFSSIDALSSQAYSAEITGIQNRLWYDITYTNKMFYPGFELNGYSDPQFFAIQNSNTGERFSLMRQDRGLSLTMPFDYTFRGDTRLTSISVSPEISAEQFKYYNLEPSSLTDFTTRYKAGLFSQLNIGVLNFKRDIQPSSGISFFGLYEQTLNEPEVSIPTPIGTFNSNFDRQWVAYYGVFGFVSPLRRWNQSLRLDLQFLQQSASPIYSNDTIIPMGFKSGAFPNFRSGQDVGFQNLSRISTRYTIPLWYPDTGGLTLPLYLSSIYLTTFTHTLTDMDANDLVRSSRSIFGAGFHVQFKVSNLLFDLGVGLAYEPTRNNTQFIFGQF